ncbi:MAG: hypothetical protein ACRDTT_22275, partial [Pseudonocardiaceae bacterium]
LNTRAVRRSTDSSGVELGTLSVVEGDAPHPAVVHWSAVGSARPWAISRGRRQPGLPTAAPSRSWTLNGKPPRRWCAGRT